MDAIIGFGGASEFVLSGDLNETGKIRRHNL